VNIALGKGAGNMFAKICEVENKVVEDVGFCRKLSKY
jgi:hypothetical protein